MPRKKKSSPLASLVKRVHYRKTKKKRDREERNPSRFWGEMKDTGMELLPTVGAFGGSTVLVRLFERFMARFDKKLGPLSRHAALLAWAATILTVYLATTKIKSLRKWRSAALVGTGLASLVHLVPKYIPMLGWLVGQPMVKANGTQSRASLPTPASEIYMPSNGSGLLPAPEAEIMAGADEALLQDDEWGGATEAVSDAEDADLYQGVFERN